MLNFSTVVKGSIFSSFAIAVPSVAKSVSGMSMLQKFLIQADSSGCENAEVVARRAFTLSIFWLAKKLLIFGGNQAMGAPSGLSACSAAKRAVAALACCSSFLTLFRSFF